jgi:hypothetical protein
MILVILVLLGVGEARAQTADVHFLDLDELWEVGADEFGDVIFGVISSVTVDGDGNVYVIDRQLTEVSMFSAAGEYLGPIGREGEGPGEYSRIGHVFVSRPGEIAVVQRMPGRIVTVNTDGTPGESVPLPEAFESSPAYFFAAERAGDGLVLSARQLARSPEGIRMTTVLSRVAADGSEIARFSEKTEVRNQSALKIEEKSNAPVLWAVDEAGNVYMNDEFDAFAVKVYDSSGSLVRTISRPYEHRQRTKQEMEVNTPRMRIRQRGGGGVVEAEGIPSETDRDVQAIFVRPDGTVWVLGSHGAFDAPEGILATFDVFGADGTWLRQVALRGEGSFREDGIHLVGDRVFVTRGFQAALRADRGIGTDEDEGAEPMSVVCYQLASDVGAVAGGR